MSIRTNNIFYNDDIVYRFNDDKRIIFGIVLDSYDSLDYTGHSTLKKGQILIEWSNTHRKQICKQDMIKSVNRNILPGNIVQRLDDKHREKGYCKSITQSVTVQIVGTDKIIENLSTNRLCRPMQFERNDAVCLGTKFGRIINTEKLLRMKSKCGSIVEITKYNLNIIRDYWTGRFCDGYDASFYPGQIVQCVPLFLRKPKWIKKSKIMEKSMDILQKFYVQSFEDILVRVSWDNYSMDDNLNYEELKDDDIKKLKVIPDLSVITLCDRMLLRLCPTDILMKNDEWLKKIEENYKHDVVLDEKIVENGDDKWLTDNDEWLTDNDETVNEFVQKNSRKKHVSKYYAKLVTNESIVAVNVLYIETVVTVIWQNGQEEKNIPSIKLGFPLSLDEYEFFPGEWIMTNSDDSIKRYGVIQNVNYLERIAKIKWFLYNKNLTIPKELTISDISVYHLKKHPSFYFRPGSIILAIPIVADKMGLVINNYPQGYVLVEWLDGKREKCWPHNIELLAHNIEDSSDSDDESRSDSDDSRSDLDSDNNSWDTISIESFVGDVTEKINLENMATKVDFVRNRIDFLISKFKQSNIDNNFNFLKDLLCVYDNSRYLDKYLNTSFFSLESKHFQTILHETKRNAAMQGIHLYGRLFNDKNLVDSTVSIKMETAEKDSLQKILDLENIINTKLDNMDNLHESNPTILCLTTELLLMLKMRMDLVYAEIISRIDAKQGLTVLTDLHQMNRTTIRPSTTNVPTPDDNVSIPDTESISTENNPESFRMLEEVHNTHGYYSKQFTPIDQKHFLIALHKEYRLLKESLPPGIWVRGYNNRLDLLSVMICGPKKTPYEDGLFLFDLQLSADYPKSPPLVHYISYSSEQLNPNLYVDGKVCVSLLGTWVGRGSEVWRSDSTLLQLIVSIQGLILVAEPYYNEAGYEKQMDTEQGHENSRIYNEIVILRLIQSMSELLNATPAVFRTEIVEHFEMCGVKFYERLQNYCDEKIQPDFPLLPMSKGLKMVLDKELLKFKTTLDTTLSTSINKNLSSTQ